MAENYEAEGDPAVSEMQPNTYYSNIKMKSIKIKYFKYLLMIFFTLFSMAVMAQNQFDLKGTAPGRNGQKVGLVGYPEGSIQPLGSATIENGQFHISIPVDEISLAVLEINKDFSIVVIIEAANLKYHITEAGTFGIEGGKYNPILLGYLRNKEFIAADALFKKITKGGNKA